MNKAILPTQTKERNEILEFALEKMVGDDFDGAVKELAKIQISPETLSFFKDCFGANWIREHNFDTTLADKAYGTGWLDQ